MPRPSRLLVLNPNTDLAVTAMMVEIAREGAPPGTRIAGMTAPFGASLILDAAALATAKDAVVSLIPELSAMECDGVVVSAFGDPGLAELRQRLSCPVVGLAEASMASAAANGGRFCVVTTTPGLVASIDAAARAYGHGAQFAGTFCTPGDPRTLMQEPARLAEALRVTCQEVAARDGTETIIIGGGPLALAARSIRDRLSVRLIEPLREAVAVLLSRREEIVRIQDA